MEVNNFVREGIQVIRIDDYPYGYPGYNHNWCRERITEVLSIFESNQVPYLLGVSPLLIDELDIELFNSIVKVGQIVMHGFNHKFDHAFGWDDIINTWPNGGEFEDLSQHEIEHRIEHSFNIMSKVNKFNRDHFIPAFNTYTQDALDALNAFEFNWIHTCDKEYNAYNYDKLVYGNIKPIISTFQKSYHDVNKINLNDPHIKTLHWIFDIQKPNWKELYAKFCNDVKNYRQVLNYKLL
jgi:hypothetical protein